MRADGRHALSGSDDRTVKLWDLVTSQSSRISIGHEGPVSAVAVSPDGRHALSGSRDCTLRLWDLATGQLLRTFDGPRTWGELGGDFPRRAPWPLRLVRPHPQALGPANRPALRTLTGHEDAVNAVAMGPDGRIALSGSSDRTLRLWDLRARS